MTIDCAQSAIMIVDDEPENLNVLEALLSSVGYRVLAFRRGERALAVARGSAPDLVLLDIRMPGMGGYEVCSRFKADERLRDIPIIFLSALSTTEDITSGFACGGVDYIAKPFHEAEVLARVHNHLALRHAYLKLAAEHAQLHLLESHRDMLTHMLVHDMRGPLQVISGHLELLTGGGKMVGLHPDSQTSLHAAIRSTRHLVQMVATVLDLSRMESADMPLNRQAVQVAEIFSAACTQVHEPANQQRIAQRISNVCPSVLCDLDLTARIVANLLGNALRHATAVEGVEIGAESSAAGVRLWVRDWGPGIPASHKERIFDKFWVAGPAAGRNPASTGLGLAFCKLAVEAQGGTIGLESEVDVGSTFWFTLPECRQAGLMLDGPSAKLA